MTVCSFPACGHRIKALGLCQGHDQQRRRGTDLRPLLVRLPIIRWHTLTVAQSLEAALARATPPTPEGCRLWPTLDDQGYGIVTIDGSARKAHRIVYEWAVGPIPEGHTLDHECHNLAAHAGTCGGGGHCRHRACIEPSHLAPRTMADNLSRSPFTQYAQR